MKKRRWLIGGLLFSLAGTAFSVALGLLKKNRSKELLDSARLIYFFPAIQPVRRN